MIIPVFLMNRGCPHRCLFCNERLAAGGNPDRITEASFHKTVRTFLGGTPRKGGPVQIAFYGGTFTGMPPREQRRLLELASPFLREGAVDGIRLSTRPDEIDAEGLDLLKAYGVTTVELGVQSLDDEVLNRVGRGHTAADAGRALSLLKEKGFEAGIHLMAGLPGDTPGRFRDTIEKTISLRPATARIHPTLVLKDTPLAEAFHRGEYRPLTLAEAVALCKEGLKKLTAAGIPVIRLGLQTTREMEEPGAVVAGPFHPAFRSLVEASVFLEMATTLLTTGGGRGSAAVRSGDEATFILSPADVSNFIGPQKENIASLRNIFDLGSIHVTADPAVPRRTLVLTERTRRLQTDFSGRITELTGNGLRPSGGC